MQADAKELDHWEAMLNHSASEKWKFVKANVSQIRWGTRMELL
jgi:hypothetical protein